MKKKIKRIKTGEERCLLFNLYHNGLFKQKVIPNKKKNVKKYDAKIEFVRSDMLNNIKNEYDFIVCNPPYVPEKEYLELDNTVLKYDPKLALVGGEDGLKFYRYLAENAHKKLNLQGTLVCEIGYNQGEKVKEILEKNFKLVEVFDDLENNNRIVVAKGVKYD